MNEMIERVAEAICTADERDGGLPWSFIRTLKHASKGYHDKARAAIAEMREPTEAMCEAGDREAQEQFLYSTAAEERAIVLVIADAFRKMMDAALNPPPRSTPPPTA
jgi:hypothetical protein